MTDLLASSAARVGRASGPGDRILMSDFALHLYATGVVQLHVNQAEFSRWPGVRPRASALARLQAKQGNSVANLLGTMAALDDPLAHLLLELLDGTRDRADLLREIRSDQAALWALEKAAGERKDETGLAEALERSLEALGRSGLFHADEGSGTASGQPA